MESRARKIRGNRGILGLGMFWLTMSGKVAPQLPSQARLDLGLRNMRVTRDKPCKGIKGIKGWRD